MARRLLLPVKTCPLTAVVGEGVVAVLGYTAVWRQRPLSQRNQPEGPPVTWRLIMARPSSSMATSPQPLTIPPAGPGDCHRLSELLVASWVLRPFSAKYR